VGIGDRGLLLHAKALNGGVCQLSLYTKGVLYSRTQCSARQSSLEGRALESAKSYGSAYGSVSWHRAPPFVRTVGTVA